MTWPQAEDVEQRGAAQGDVVAGQREVAELVEGVERQVAVGQDSAFGPAGGPGGVEDERRVVEGDAGRDGRAAVVGCDGLLVAGAA